MIRKIILSITLLGVLGCSSESGPKKSYIPGKEFEVKILETKITDRSEYIVLSEEVSNHNSKKRYFNTISPHFDNRCYRQHLPREGEVWHIALNAENEQIIEFIYISE